MILRCLPCALGVGEEPSVTFAHLASSRVWLSHSLSVVFSHPCSCPFYRRLSDGGLSSSFLRRACIPCSL